MKMINKEKRKKKGALGFVSHVKVKMVSKQKKKPRLPLITAYKNLKQKNAELARNFNCKLDEIKELKEKHVQLISKNMGLLMAYKKQTEAFSRLEKQSKMALAMIPGFVDAVGGIISTCQHFNSGPSIPQRFDELNETQKRNSQGTPMKSPSCVVLPTVSGHTITKPTINLSRLNIERVGNSPNLSRIEESSPSPRNSLASSPHSQTNGRISTENQVDHHENSRVGNISERLDTSNLSTDEEESHRTSERVQLPPKRQPSKNRRSSMFERLSLSRYSIAPSPRVHLKDVSKVLRNSQSINVRVLDQRLSNGMRTDISEENQQSSSSDSSLVSNQSFDSVNDNTKTANDSHSDSVDENQNDTIKAESSRLSNDCSGSTSKNNTLLDDDVDPLEGTSWKYKSVDSSTDILKQDESLYSSKRLQNDDDDSEDEEEDEVNDDEDRTEQVVNYVNIEQRGSIADMDDFTLCIKKNKPPRRTRFNINDYSLPNLDVSLLEPLERRPEIPEIDDITCTMINITEKIKSYHPKTDAFDDQDMMTVKLPREPSMLVESTPLHLSMRKRKTFTPAKMNSNNTDEEEHTPAKNLKRQSKQKKLEKDPSAAKVVLKKLTNSRSEEQAKSSGNERLSSPIKTVKRRPGRKVKKAVPMFSDSDSEEEFDKQLKRKSKPKSHLSEVSHRGDSSDSECSVDSASKNSLRPKRKAAPRSLVEPKLNRKMRR